MDYNRMTFLSSEVSSTYVVMEVERIINKDYDRLFDLPPISELYLNEDDSNKGLKGFVHKVLSHKPYQYKKEEQFDPVVEWDCIYQELLPYEYYKDLLNHISYKNDVIWWVDKDDNLYDLINNRLIDIYFACISFLNKKLNLGLNLKLEDFIVNR